MKKELPSKRMEEIAETVEDMAQYKEDLYEREELKEETLQLVVFGWLENGTESRLQK